MMKIKGKNIIIVLFLILTISVPAFAKQKQEPEWIPIVTEKDGIEWFYDLNTIHEFKGVQEIGLIVKSYNPTNKVTKKYAYMLGCTSETSIQQGYGGYAYKENVSIKKMWYSPFSWKIPEQEQVSGILYNEFCRGM